MTLEDALKNEARLFWTPFWRTDREITSHFENAGRPLCGHHIVALVENAEAEMMKFASRVKVAGFLSESVNETTLALLNTFASDKRRVSEGWPTPAVEVLDRELTRALASLQSSLESQPPLPNPHEHSASLSSFEEPKADWIELWQGPLTFRATYDRGQFQPGHTLERINQYGAEHAILGDQNSRLYSVALDPVDGAVVIEWLVGRAGTQPPYPTIRHYHLSLNRIFYDRLRDDPLFRDSVLSHLEPDDRERAVGAYARGISIRNWIEREFFEAVHAGHCEIWARLGSKVAPFSRIPPDIFRAYQIETWGYGVPGGAWASLEDSSPIYSIHVAASEAFLSEQRQERKRDRMAYPETVQWCREWIDSGNGNGMDKAWTAFKRLPGASGCTRDHFFRPAWIDAKTKNF